LHSARAAEPLPSLHSAKLLSPCPACTGNPCSRVDTWCFQCKAAEPLPSLHR
ncbi:hypothetical protein DV515_00019844, partial [Chloebia gouldiae]